MMREQESNEMYMHVHVSMKNIALTECIYGQRVYPE